MLPIYIFCVEHENKKIDYLKSRRFHLLLIKSSTK
uniref:Uncharacterized protein n=1 Tax=viral metagenome TaxID=1070528 RepID=A0A6C0CAM1_9ZZZZ